MAWLLPAALTIVGLSGAEAQSGPRLVGSSQILLDGRSFTLTPRQAVPLGALRDSLAGRRQAVQDAALAAARRVADSLDSRYIFAVYALEIGKQRGDRALQAEALDIMIATGIPPRPKLASFLDVRGGIAFDQGDLATAGSLWTRLREIRPGDGNVLANLAQVEQARGDARAAAELIARAIAARAEAGQPAPETWYRQRLSIAGQAKIGEAAADAGLALVAAYPSRANWHDALIVYRQAAAPAGALEIELLRLTRAVGGFAKASEYQRLAQLLEHDGMAPEAKAVLGEGLASGLLSPGESPTREILAELARPAPTAAAARAMPADLLFASGRYPEAAALYRAALQARAGEPARLNLRLGTALAAAGRSAEAEAALKAAAADPAPAAAGYRELARFWLAWLAQPRAAPRPA